MDVSFDQLLPFTPDWNLLTLKLSTRAHGSESVSSRPVLWLEGQPLDVVRAWQTLEQIR